MLECTSDEILTSSTKRAQHLKCIKKLNYTSNFFSMELNVVLAHLNYLKTLSNSIANTTDSYHTDTLHNCIPSIMSNLHIAIIYRIPPVSAQPLR